MPSNGTKDFECHQPCRLSPEFHESGTCEHELHMPSEWNHEPSATHPLFTTSGGSEDSVCAFPVAIWPGLEELRISRNTEKPEFRLPSEDTLSDATLKPLVLVDVDFIRRC